MDTKWKKKGSGKWIYFGFTLIPVALYSFFYVYSVINGVRYSFTDWDGMSTTFHIVGFKNYISLFKNPNFWGSLKTTVCYSILLVAGVVTLSLALSLSLNSLKNLEHLQNLYFCPCHDRGNHDRPYLGPAFYRVVPLVGQALGIGWLSQSLLMTGKTALPAVVFVHIWQAVALPTVIFVAGLQQIPDEQYESAKMDGATPFQRFRFVTFPYLVPTLTVNLVLMIKQGFTSFDFPFALTGGGPVRSTEVIGILIYNDAFKNMRFSMANAEACVLFLVVAVFSLTQLKLTSKGGVHE
ncbi:sugar ABC transporter permease [Blautia sp. RD014234]|nr:sugar ABC transporter permease [Blautia parvula]